MTCCGHNGTPFVQTLFMGASITQFSATAGWNDGDGGIQIEVVEDTCAGNTRVYSNGPIGVETTTIPDAFCPPKVGSPCYFWYGGFQGGGILENWYESDSPTDAKVYNIKLGSPNKILAGVQCILGNYDGTITGTGVPNLINVHGLLTELMCSPCYEAGFDMIYPPQGIQDRSSFVYVPAGAWCKVPETGWRWSEIRAALNYATGFPGGADWGFGGPISYRGYTYLVDFSELPTLNNEVRIGGESKSLLELIQFVCSLRGVDFFLEVIPQGGAIPGTSGNLGPGPHIIKIRVGDSPIAGSDYSANDVDLTACSPVSDRLDSGKIGGAIADSECVMRYQRGLELRAPVIVNALITGEFRHDIFQVDADEDCEGNGRIWPYWGREMHPSEDMTTNNTPGKVLVGKKCLRNDDDLSPNTHHFEIDIRYLQIPNSDPNDPEEIISKWDINVSELRAAMMGSSQWRGFLYNLDQAKFKKLLPFNEKKMAKGLTPGQLPSKISDGLDTIFATAEAGDKAISKAADAYNSWAENVKRSLTNDGQEGPWLKSEKLYDVVKMYAHNYFGKQFMVVLPFICSSVDIENQYGYGLNWSPADGGWAEGPVLGVSPLDIEKQWVLNKFRTDDGRIRCFAKFNEHRMVLDAASKNDLYIISYSEVYVGGKVEDIVPVEVNGNWTWRAIVNIGGPVRRWPDDNIPDEVRLGLCMLKAERPVDVAGNKYEKYRNGFFTAGHDKNIFGAKTAFMMPTSIAVPLKSNKLVYGPWYASSGIQDNGQTHYEREASFAPWNFGNNATLNMAAMWMAASCLGDKVAMENGTIVFPGSPTTRLGSMLATGGPRVSGIDVTVSRGDGAVSTQIRMKTYTPDFGKMIKYRIDNMRKSISISQKNERMFKNMTLAMKEKEKASEFNTMLNHDAMKPFAGFSSKEFLFGESGPDMFTDNDNDWARGTVVSSEIDDDIVMLQPWYGENVDISIDECGKYPDGTNEAKHNVGRHWRRKAYMENVGMFRPFSTIYNRRIAEVDDGQYLSHFSEIKPAEKCAKENPGDTFLLNTSGGAEDNSWRSHHTYYYPTEQLPPIFCKEPTQPISINTLSPFLASGNTIMPNGTSGWEEDDSLNLSRNSSVGHDIEYIARDGVYPTHLCIREPCDNYSIEHWYRAIALRGPLVIAGWGYDIDNHPVPNENTTDWKNWSATNGPKGYFMEDWLRKPHKWPCGPVDLRWDYRRGVWVAPTPHKIVKLVLAEWLCPSEPGVDRCAQAILYDDLMQFDMDGQAVKVDSACGYTGYKVTVYSTSRLPIPPGWTITAYFDTARQKYYLLGHDEIPEVIVTLTQNMLCDDDENELTTEGIIEGFAGCNLDTCSALTGKTIKLKNPMKQPICSGKKVIAKICGANCTDTSDKFTPILENCNQQCKQPDDFVGIVLQAEFTPICLVRELSLMEYHNWKCKTFYDNTDHIYITPTGTVVGCNQIEFTCDIEVSNINTVSGNCICTGDYCYCDCAYSIGVGEIDSWGQNTCSVDLTDGLFAFSGDQCDILFKVQYTNFWEFFRYNLCITLVQIYLQAATGDNVTSMNNSAPEWSGCDGICEDRYLLSSPGYRLSGCDTLGALTDRYQGEFKDADTLYGKVYCSVYADTNIVTILENHCGSSSAYCS